MVTEERMTDPDADELRYLLRDGQHLREASLTGGRDGSREYTGEYAWDGRIWGVRWEFPPDACSAVEAGDQDESCLPWEDPRYVTVAAEEISEDAARGDVLPRVVKLALAEHSWPEYLVRGSVSDALAGICNDVQDDYGEALRACKPALGQQVVYELREAAKRSLQDFNVRRFAPAELVSYEAKAVKVGNSLYVAVPAAQAARIGGVQKGETVVVTLSKKKE